MAQVFFTIIHEWPPTLPTPLKGMTEKWNIQILFVLRAKSRFCGPVVVFLCPFGRDANVIFHRTTLKK